MRSSYLIPCLVLILMGIHGSLSRVKSRHSKSSSNKKSSSSGPNVPNSNTAKTTISLKPGQLIYGPGGPLTLHFNMTDESEAYAANYTMFPVGLHYFRPSTVNNSVEFLGLCMNTTLELEENKERLSLLRSDVNTRVTLRVLEYLCTENYNRPGNNVGSCPRGSWVVTTVIAMLLLIKALD